MIRHFSFDVVLFNPAINGWEWLGVRLNNGLDANIFLIFNFNDNTVIGGLANVILPSGEKRFISFQDLEVTRGDYWLDPTLTILYPTTYQINIPSLGLPFTNVAAFLEQEKHGYWEGYCDITGNYNQQEVAGFSYTEIVYRNPTFIKTIFAKLDQSKNTYHRSIIMLIDSNKERNNLSFAQVNNEAMVVELAFITMNFNELPKKIIEGVLHTSVPFGKLLAESNLQILTKDRSYFTIRCNKTFTSLIHCNLNDVLYGRTNTIIRVDNKKWLAHVVEILPRLPESTLKTDS